LSAPLSIVVPVHNNAALTAACLDAVLSGSGPVCEVVVVDDASTDSTPEVLARYGDSIAVVRLRENAGYAGACNEGAAAARGELLVFLNNDTVPRGGWAEALAAYAAEHPAAAAIGAKLLYPTGAVQHAGVVIGQDGYPHNLYAGLPADHPAVNRSRRLQAVTGACMLVRRDAFEQIGGFDTGFLNSLEDVDLCLRIAEAGGEVHYCHEAVVTHLESASRGREGRFRRSVELYKERWRRRVRRDDLAIYAEDGLLDVEYAESYPLRLSVSPHLAAVDAGREAEIERLLESYARQASDLLGEVVRLTAVAGGVPGTEPLARKAAAPASLGADFDYLGFAAEANRLEEEVRMLQQRLENAGKEGFTASTRLGYRRMVERVRATVARSVPSGSAVLVVSRGDRDLVDLDGLDGRHFPQDPGGRYLGHHPLDSADAVSHLETLREDGAEYLVLPATAYWWLEHYAGFASHLESRYPRTDADVCSIFRLDVVEPPGETEAVESR
jgi:GT2 family glycosyltransferase